MAIEYKLSYTAEEIDEKLGKIDNAVTQENFNKMFSDSIKNITPEQIGAAPEKAIIDQSRLEEEELFNSSFEWLSWKKYIDGTFALWARFSVYLDDDREYIEDYADPVVPFDVYEITEYSWMPDSFYDYDNAVISKLDVRAGAIFEDGGLPEISITYYSTDEMFEKMRELEITDVSGYIYINLTGKWRIDE